MPINNITDSERFIIERRGGTPMMAMRERADHRYLHNACIRALCGDPAPLVTLFGIQSTGPLVRFCTRHGIHALLHDALLSTGSHAPPIRLLDSLRPVVQHEAARSLAQHAELLSVATALQHQGIRFLGIKGIPLAYACYRTPALRPRADLDLLFHEHDIQRAQAVLSDLGYRCETLVTPLHRSVFLTTQLSCTRSASDRMLRIIDAHWRLNNCIALADAISFDELIATAKPIASLDNRLKVPEPVHNLLIASMHRATEPDKDRLIWLYDIHLLIQQLDDERIEHVIDLTASKGLVCVLLDAVIHIQTTFKTANTGELLRALRRVQQHRPPEPAAALLATPHNRLRRELAEWWALRSWRTRLRMLTVRLFPPRSYLRRQGMAVDRQPLAWLYCRRLAQGLANLRRVD